MIIVSRIIHVKVDRRLNVTNKFKCIRTIAKARYNAHSGPIFYELKILPFSRPYSSSKTIVLALHSF